MELVATASSSCCLCFSLNGFSPSSWLGSFLFCAGMAIISNSVTDQAGQNSPDGDVRITIQVLLTVTSPSFVSFRSPRLSEIVASFLRWAVGSPSEKDEGGSAEVLAYLFVHDGQRRSEFVRQRLIRERWRRRQAVLHTLLHFDAGTLAAFPVWQHMKAHPLLSCLFCATPHINKRFHLQYPFFRFLDAAL